MRRDGSCKYSLEVQKLYQNMPFLYGSQHIGINEFGGEGSLFDRG
jgi:hypothetical protein